MFEKLTNATYFQCSDNGDYFDQNKTKIPNAEMEEVDAIILQSLREIGCDLDDDARLKTLTPEDIFKCIGRLCKCIKSDVEIATHLPAQMAQRFAAASQLVDCCKSLGFNGDLGYQTILYANPIELRRIFMWLIEHLPKSEDKTDSFHQSRDVSRAKLIENEILRKVAMDLKRPWVLEFLQPQANVKCEAVQLEKPDVTENTNNGKTCLNHAFNKTQFFITPFQTLLSLNESLSRQFSIKPDRC